MTHPSFTLSERERKRKKLTRSLSFLVFRRTFAGLIALPPKKIYLQRLKMNQNKKEIWLILRLCHCTCSPYLQTDVDESAVIGKGGEYVKLITAVISLRQSPAPRLRAGQRRLHLSRQSLPHCACESILNVRLQIATGGQTGGAAR